MPDYTDQQRRNVLGAALTNKWLRRMFLKDCISEGSENPVKEIWDLLLPIFESEPEKFTERRKKYDLDHEEGWQLREIQNDNEWFESLKVGTKC